MPLRATSTSTSPGPGVGLRHLLDPDVRGPVVDGRLHVTGRLGHERARTVVAADLTIASSYHAPFGRPTGTANDGRRGSRGDCGEARPVRRRAHLAAAHAELGRRARETIDRILDATRAVFLAQGYGGTSIDDIARHAGISPGVVLHVLPDQARSAARSRCRRDERRGATSSISSAHSVTHPTSDDIGPGSRTTSRSSTTTGASSSRGTGRVRRRRDAGGPGTSTIS